ncbi:hypothetical protein CUJ86_01245 [Methanofollis fontis]|uniref:Uncharacterized protein n=2 Tax=Methanofollis fontis TaxID=2052832 RepID=A0A483CUU5_9EURY|nr:hypothetical protein CUJ86_01245 [Methanofollis fontis]
MFLAGTYLFYQAQNKYGGNLKKIATFLMWGGVTGFIATAFRYGGDYFAQYKWGESTLFLLFALISLFVAYLVYTKFMEIAEAFGMAGGDE